MTFPPKSDEDLTAETISICYILLVHDHPEFAMRLIHAILNPRNSVVIHVDRKAEEVWHKLFHWTANYPNVYMVPFKDCVRVNWGGYSVVNATLVGMSFALAVVKDFDYLADISGTSFPVKSNKVIAKTLANKKNAIYMAIGPDAMRPLTPEMWNHYIECDDIVHRVGRLPIPRGIDLFQGSQWFFLPRHVVQWFISDNLPREFSNYARRVVVADETFFTTMIKNSPYCDDIEETNHLFLLFDRWENEKNTERDSRDSRKCLHPNPDHCGRSPMTLTKEFKRYVTMTQNLFARKFDPANEESMELVGFIESIRDDDGKGLQNLYKLDHGGSVMILTTRPTNESDNDTARGDSTSAAAAACSVSDPDCELKKHDLITEETLADYLCLEIMKAGHKLRLAKCEPSLPFQWFNIGPCTDNTDLTIPDGGCATSPSRSQREQHDMLCQITSTSKHNQVCVDVMGENILPGSKVIAYGCTGGWNQLFRLSTDCSLSVTQPDIVGHSRGDLSKNMTMCIKTQKLEKGGYELTTDDCSNGANSKDYPFKFLRKDGTLIKSIKSSLNIDTSDKEDL